MSDLSVTKIEANEVLVVPDHGSEPLVVGPASESGDGVDGSNVEEDEEETPSTSGEGLVVRGDLLGSDGLEQGLHVVEVREHNWVLLRVIRVHVTLLHLFHVGLVVAFAILHLVYGFLPSMNG